MRNTQPFVGPSKHREQLESGKDVRYRISRFLSRRCLHIGRSHPSHHRATRWLRSRSSACRRSNSQDASPLAVATAPIYKGHLICCLYDHPFCNSTAHSVLDDPSPILSYWEATKNVCSMHSQSDDDVEMRIITISRLVLCCDE